MNRDMYSNSEFLDIKERLNKQILRRATFTWWDPLATPRVGEDRSEPLSLPATGDQVHVNDETYTINNPSLGSIEPTRNILYPLQGENPGGIVPSSFRGPITSAAQMNADEMRNFLVGLAKIQDINLFYGRDEIPNLALRDPQGIEDALVAAEQSVKNVPLAQSPIGSTKPDPNGGIQDYKHPHYPQPIQVEYPMENGEYVMPSGERDGEELQEGIGVGVFNFFDDYGAKPGDSHYHPYNRATSPMYRKDRDDQGEGRDELPTKVWEGGIPASTYGTNPRNPNPGEPLASRPVYGGVPGSCNVACTGLCYVTCDNECSESCMTTCWNRCGEACTASCGNVCTGCSTMCYQSCKTKCENSVGYACVKAGAKAIRVETYGGKDGEPVTTRMTIDTHTCTGCSYSCQFYPNKKTECWDSGCMGRCFTSCNTACSTSCYGGCVGNEPEDTDDFKTGKGRGCGAGCTLNCVGTCYGTCEGYCVQTCWHACKQQCSDNCSWACSTNCGNGCAQGCTQGCTGCTSCTGSCMGQSYQRTCKSCSSEAGCTATCQQDCNKNCIGWGCRSICGIEAQGSCEANCRLNCMSTSCTAMCSDACSGECSTCVNTCGFMCGACSSACSMSCSHGCNYTCTENCEHTCDLNCVTSCSEECGGCSDLCYSCVGMCIGICSVRCQDNCSSCTNNCGWWCDSSCSRECFSNCNSFCINTCSGSCATFLDSNTQFTSGPERSPTSDGYIYKYPKNRLQERESFKILRDYGKVEPYVEREYIVKIYFDKETRDVIVEKPDSMLFDLRQSTINGGVWSINHETGETEVNGQMLYEIVPTNEPNFDKGDGVYCITLYYDWSHPIEDSDVLVKVPFGFEVHPFVHLDGNTIVIIERDPFLMHGEGEPEDGKDLSGLF